MPTLSSRAARLLAVMTLILCASAQGAFVNLAWEPSPDEQTPGKVEGYILYYSLENFAAPNQGDVPVASLTVGLNTQAAIPDAVSGLTYYFAVVTVDTNGVESEFSNVVAYTVPADVVPLPDGLVTEGPEPTPGGSPSTLREMSLIGMLPRLWLYPTNGEALIAVQGTVGATFSIQSSTNPATAGSWTTITNIKLSVPAPGTSLTPETTLEKAFMPALEAIRDPNPTDGTLRYYRIYMAPGYVILADQVLRAQGYDTRLIAVRCAGSTHIVCYINEEAAYLDYNSTTHLVKLETSGPTIREVANNVAAALQQSWTSASEFRVAADGTKRLFATVIEMDDPLSDPPLGVPRTSAEDILDF
jgi:hypothetical protein